jgi:hypothetical protein
VKRLGKVAGLRELGAILQAPVALVIERDGTIHVDARPLDGRVPLLTSYGTCVRSAIANAATHHREYTAVDKAALTKLADRVLGRKP